MNTILTRRTFLQSAAAGTGVMTASGTAGALPGFSAIPAETAWKPFMDQYYDGALDIVRGIRDTQVDVIARAMEKAFELKKAGGRVYSQVVFGHYAGYAGAKDIPGQPWVLPQSSISPKKEEFAAMKKGDFLITNMVNEDTKDARSRGVFVVGVTNNYYKHWKTPAEGLDPSRMKISLEEISDLIIDSYVPWDNGLVSAPQVYRFKLCPSTGIAQFAVYWACSAALANLVGSQGKGSAADPAKKYLDLVCDRFLMVGTDRPKVDRMGKKWADLVLGSHARLWVYGRPSTIEGYGSGNMFVSDANSAASGSMIASSFVPDKTELREKDIVLVGSVLSRDAGEIGVARAAKKAGASTAAFCPFTADGDSSGERLFKEVDDALDNHCGESAGVIEVPGFASKVCPISGLTGLLDLWMLTAAWTDHMARRGEMPYYWQGLHELGGREYDAMVRPYFEKRGY